MDDNAAWALTGLMDVLAALDAAYTCGRPGPDQAARLAELLGTRRLTDWQRREVAFVAGIRLSMPATGAAPD